jgi:shikimate dehydrogenase
MHLNLNKDTVLCMSLASRPGNFGTRFQNYLYEALDLNFVYKAFTTDDLEGAVRGIRALKIRGCAVSMPFKEKVIPYLDELDPSAKRIGAVNTIVNDQGFLRAYNTDYIAVHQLLSESGISPSSSVALHGSGGMAKAIAAALAELQFRDVTIIARNAETGSALADTYQFKHVIGINGGANELKPGAKFDLLINVTPIGMFPNVEKLRPFSDELIAGAKTVFDAVGNPPETELIKQAQSLGKKTISGFQILVIQAIEQFRMYTGVTPDAALVKKAAEFARS